MSTTLPEALVQRILAMVPYPNIIKARVLSKSWLARLSSVSSHDGDEEKKRLAVAFKKTVGGYSSKWTTFCPIFVGKEDLIAYEESSQHWQSIPTLSFLPQNHFTKSTRLTQQMQGALLLIETQHGDLSVANVLTRSWKLLPPLPQQDKVTCLDRMLVTDTETYKMIEFGRFLDSYLAQIYISKLDSYSSKRLDVSNDFALLGYYGEYLDGVLYWVGCWRIEMTPYLLALNVKEGTFKLLQMVLTNVQVEVGVGFVNLVVHNGSLLMFVYDLDFVTLVKADLGSQRWLEVSQVLSLVSLGKGLSVMTITYTSWSKTLTKFWLTMSRRMSRVHFLFLLLCAINTSLANLMLLPFSPV